MDSWILGFVGSWARTQLWKHQRQWQDPEVPLSHAKGCFRAPVAIGACLGAWCLVRSGQGPGGDGNPETLAPSGNKNRRAETTSPASPPIGLVAWWDHHGQGSAVATGRLEGLEGGRGRTRRFFCSSSPRDEKETAETRKIQARSVRGTTGERDARLSQGWRVVQMINTSMANEPA